MSNMESLRRGAQNINNGKSGKEGRGRGFYARWRPPFMAEGLKKYLAAPPNEESFMGVAEPIVLIPGEYPDVYARDESGAPIVPPPLTEGLRFRSHTFNVMVPGTNGQRGYNQYRDIICSAGAEAHAPQPCIGCAQNDAGVDGKPRDQWVFEIAHLGWYHSSPLIKDGQVQKKKNGEIIFVRTQCDTQNKANQILGRAHAGAPRDWKEPVTCEGCRSNHGWAWGDHRTIQVGKKHLTNLLDLNDKVGQKCANCGTHILRVGFDCPKCFVEFLDVASTGWTNQQLDQYSKAPLSCHNCNYQGVPAPIYSCGFNEKFVRVAQECSAPTQMSIWDCVIWVQREGEKMDSELIVPRIDAVSTFQTPDGRPLKDHIMELTTPRYDLREMHKPDSLDDQAKRLFIQNPYHSQQQYQPYPSK